MTRNLLICCLVGCLLALPASASAAPGSVAGKLTDVGGWSFTVQTPGRAVGVVDALSTAANRVTNQDYPYVYGGGHAQAGIASVGIKGPGYNGRRVGYDCSGSVAAVLAGAGLWPAGGGVPNDAGIISELLGRGLIAPGPGRGPVEVTLYDDPGIHIFMNIDGRFFGTSDGGGGGDRRGGAGWLDDGAPDATSRTYRRYHVVPAALRQSTDAGHTVTFQAGALRDSLPGLALGEKVRVSYRQTRAGTLVASAITYPGEITTSGVVESVTPGSGSLTIKTSSGAELTFTANGLGQVLQGLVVGDTVQVSYTKGASTLIVHALTVTATVPSAAVPPTSGSASGPAGANTGSGGDGSGWSDGGGNGWSASGGNGWSGGGGNGWSPGGQ